MTKQNGFYFAAYLIFAEEALTLSMPMNMRKKFINYSATFVDQYELAMGQVYFQLGRLHEKATFDYFFRKIPFNSGYVIFAGLNDILEILEKLKFNEDDLEFLAKLHFDHDYLNFLKNFRFTGNVYACEEGEVVFPQEPIVRIEANLIEAQMIETLVLNILNFESLIATKASRMRFAAPDKTLVEYGLRRAQGPGGYYASRASVIGGFDGTSNVLAAKDYNLISSGTMAHSFIQSEDKELEAFRKFAEHRPQDCVLLIDTFNTLESGLPNAIMVAHEMEKRGKRLKGIRLDSGDLSYLAHECRIRLNKAGLNYVKIIASNQLNEDIIKSLEAENAPIDIYGVGTSLVTGNPDAALDGVYKLSDIDNKPKMKVSDSIKKVSFPCKKQIFRVFDREGNFFGADAVGLIDEVKIEIIHHPIESLTSLDLSDLKKVPLHKICMKEGRRISKTPGVSEMRDYSKNRLKLLPDEFKRFTNPHIYKIGLTTKLKTIREDLILKFKERK